VRNKEKKLKDNNLKDLLFIFCLS